LFAGQLALNVRTFRTYLYSPSVSIAHQRLQVFNDGFFCVCFPLSCAVNALPFSEEQKAACVDEGNMVFSYNIAIFEELEGSSFKAIFTLALAALKDKFRIG